MKNEHYDGTKLLSVKDINGSTPEIFMSTSNRTAGKTTFFNRWCVNKYKEGKGKFGVLVRFNNQLDDCSGKFFKDINDLFFPKDDMTHKIKDKGSYAELYLNGESCGYVLAVNSADRIKQCSHYFADISRMVMDEFQSETNHYCPNEVEKFQSIHTSIARGQGKIVRYVPVVMISNPVTLLNPYYVAMGISSRLNSKVKILRGDGFVLEQNVNKKANELQKTSAFNRAFGKSKYVAYASECIYLNDQNTFIEPVKGYGKYLATIKYRNKNYAIKEYTDQGIIYCDDRPDMTFPVKISITTESHDINYVMLRRNDLIINTMRYFFERGCFRFKDLQCKEAILKMLSY